MARESKRHLSLPQHSGDVHSEGRGGSARWWWQLFAERGFDEVSVTEIAAAAGVAEKTVYNYFPVKADMFFDEASDILAELLAAVRCRAAGQPVLAAVRTFMAGRAEWAAGRRPAQPTGRFRQLIANSTALQAHQRLMFGRYESALASLLAAHPPRRPERQPEQLTFSCRARVVDRYGWLAQITAAGEPVTDSC